MNWKFTVEKKTFPFSTWIFLTLLTFLGLTQQNYALFPFRTVTWYSYS